MVTKSEATVVAPHHRYQVLRDRDRQNGCVPWYILTSVKDPNELFLPAARRKLSDAMIGKPSMRL